MEQLNLEYIIQNQDTKSTFRKITDLYFAPKSFEKDGRVYEFLGVKYAQRIVMATAGKLRRKKDEGCPSNYFIGKNPHLESLMIFERGTRFNETTHAPVVLLETCCLAATLSQENMNYTSVGVITGALILNFYLTILQRYNRARVYNVIEKMKNKS